VAYFPGLFRLPFFLALALSFAVLAALRASSASVFR
jgi:hypothetical protein